MVMMIRPLCLYLLFIVSIGVACGQDDRFYTVDDILLGSTTDNSRAADWKPGDGLVLEATGLAMMDGNRLAVAIRKGEVWFLDGVSGDPEKITYTQFATGLDEPLGLLRRDGALLLTQRSEVTELRDTDGDDIADSYLTLAKGWNVSGNYHGYAYGPALDKNGDLWVTLNLDIGEGANNSAPWRGWGMRLKADGTVEPMCAGMRSPCGLGSNAAGDLFFTDQQGNWIPTNTLHHLRKGVFYGNPEGMAPAAAPDSPVKPLVAKIVDEPYPEALTKLPQLVPPAVWFPYGTMGRSRTGIKLDTTQGKFGPYSGQLFIGEFTTSKVGRVFLEKIDGEYQGACFPFLNGFPCAVMQMEFGADGSMFVGMSNRGWSSLGSAAYGLQRLRWTGEIPFEVKEMRARADGFELTFTRPVAPDTATNPTSYEMTSFTYPLHSAYGGDEILRQNVPVTAASVSDDRLRVTLTCGGLRPFFVHALRYKGVRSSNGALPWHDRAYYTLNRIPEHRKVD
ncbi:MAG: hypothetical protein KDN22_25600 [Verrucomicrobiae bacterium]|nr:hypothetical protein [Verrucomicrobiae bacterium]